MMSVTTNAPATKRNTLRLRVIVHPQRAGGQSFQARLLPNYIFLPKLNQHQKTMIPPGGFGETGASLRRSPPAASNDGRWSTLALRERQLPDIPLLVPCPCYDCTDSSVLPCRPAFTDDQAAQDVAISVRSRCIRRESCPNRAMSEPAQKPHSIARRKSLTPRCWSAPIAQPRIRCFRGTQSVGTNLASGEIDWRR